MPISNNQPIRKTNTMTKHKRTIAALLCTVVALFSVGVQAAIIGISKPVDSNDGASRPVFDGVWSVSTPPHPLATNSGIGYIINSTYVLDEALDVTVHDHQYESPFIPDTNRAVITYFFDQPAVVKSVRVIQHGNGVTKLEGFVGNSVDAMTSIGSVFGDRGDITGSYVFTEGEASVFTFTNSQPALYFRFIIRKTSLGYGYALYRAFLRDATDTVIPPESGLFVTIELADVDVCWPSKSNKVYQVEYRSSLTAGAWLQLGPTVQGNGTTNCITDVVRGQPQKFYRVAPVP